jgi:hydroxyethylthiazole kinase-like uncharacterized protein yjeF
METFSRQDIKRLYTPPFKSRGEDNGQITIIGGSSLFHGAPLLSLKAASRIVDMVFFATPDPGVGEIAQRLKSELLSFIWVPWAEVDHYVEKSDAVLIGPGFMRFKSERVPHGERMHECDEACRVTRQITKDLLQKFPSKKWVIDAGSLQTMVPQWIPRNAILTPNEREYAHLFDSAEPFDMAKAYDCIVVYKSAVTTVSSSTQVVQVVGGNPGLTKGGTGDVQSGVTAALLAKNDPFLAACAGSFVVKAAADAIYSRVGVNYNADDLADTIPQVLANLQNE